jgi:hypothetical protein
LAASDTLQIRLTLLDSLIYLVRDSRAGALLTRRMAATEVIEHAGVSAGRCCHPHRSPDDKSGTDQDFRDHF